MPTIMYPAQFDDEEAFQQEVGQQTLEAIDLRGSTYYGFDEEEDWQQYIGQEMTEGRLRRGTLPAQSQATTTRGKSYMPQLPMLLIGGVALASLAVFMVTKRR